MVLFLFLFLFLSTNSFESTILWKGSRHFTRFDGNIWKCIQIISIWTRVEWNTFIHIFSKIFVSSSSCLLITSNFHQMYWVKLMIIVRPSHSYWNANEKQGRKKTEWTVKASNRIKCFWCKLFICVWVFFKGSMMLVYLLSTFSEWN